MILENLELFEPTAQKYVALVDHDVPLELRDKRHLLVEQFAAQLVHRLIPG